MNKYLINLKNDLKVSGKHKYLWALQLLKWLFNNADDICFVLDLHNINKSIDESAAAPTRAASDAWISQGSASLFLFSRRLQFSQHSY